MLARDQELDWVYDLAEPFEPVVGIGSMSVSAPRLQAAKGRTAGAGHLRMQGDLGSGLLIAHFVPPVVVLSRWDRPGPVSSVDVLCSSRLAVVRRLRACDPSLGSRDALEARSSARCLAWARSSALEPVAVVPEEEDLTAQRCPCPDTPAAGHGDCYPAAQSASMVSAQAAAAVAVTAVRTWCSGGAADSRRPGFSAQPLRSGRSELAGWSMWSFLQCQLRQSELRFRRREAE
jgi:hypothetical protein